MSISTNGRDKNTCEWTDNNTDEFLDILLEFYRQGKSTVKSLSESVWNEVMVELNKRTGMQYNIPQIKEKNTKMKKEWATFHGLIMENGGGWNSQRCTIDVPPAKLEKFKVYSLTWKNVELKKFQQHGLERYEDMNEMWAKGIASGGFARSSNNAQMSVEEVREQMSVQYAYAQETTPRVVGNTTYKGSMHRKQHHVLLETQRIKVVTVSPNNLLSSQVGTV